MNFNSLAQTVNEPGGAVYVEILGRAYLTFNYEYPLNKANRIYAGLGWNDFETNLSNGGHEAYPYLVFSPIYSHLWGKKIHYFEAGIGFSYAFLNVSSKDDIGDIYDNPFAVNGFIGYRRQVAKGFLFRAGFTPSFSPPDDFWPLIGFSLGYSW